MEGKKYSILTIYCLLLHKLHLKKVVPNFVYNIISFFEKKDLPQLGKNPDDFLNSIHKDVCTSSICENMIEDPMVDLQIIVPVYKVEKYLERCLQSILSQKTTYSYKIVVVNDGSPDRCGEILKQYEKEENVFIITQENKGFSGARNAGLRRIFARYVGFVDSDDQLAPNAIQMWLDSAYKNKADIVDGSFKRVSPSGKVLDEYVHKSSNSHSGFVWSRIFKAELFKNLHFPEKYWFEDSLMGIIVPRVENYVSIPQCVYYYTVNPNGITKSSVGKNQTLDSFYITRALLKDTGKISGYDINANYAIDFFLKMVKITWSRTYMLGEDVEWAVFTLFRDLLLTYFPNKNTSSLKMLLLEKSLRDNDFFLYRKECFML